MVLAFYFLAVLRAWRMHSSCYDSGPVYQPEPAAVTERLAVVPEQPVAIPELPALPDTATEAVTELPALPDMAMEHPWSALPSPSPRPSALPPPSKPSALPPLRPPALPPLPRPSEPLKPAWSVETLQHRPGTQPGVQICWNPPGQFLQCRPGIQPEPRPS
ncbi:uncharacterized protein [Chanodichthys erythropterus]|uniref:uncharacterized protein n=1 Tax=Chanodichthys erythropterus TaxID=933992 RepID=UPI00351E169B